MNDLESKIRTLDEEIGKSADVLERLGSRLSDYENRQVKDCNPGMEEAMIVAQLLTHYYTCSETIFLRISQFFENSLPRESWHRALLEKMTLSIEGVRPSVISDEQSKHLLELLKFRHFTRYYFELDYDWDKLAFLLKKFHQVHPALLDSFRTFRGYLAELVKE